VAVVDPGVVLYSIACSPTTRIAGEFGVILASTDGAMWQVQKPPSRRAFRRVLSRRTARMGRAWNPPCRDHRRRHHLEEDPVDTPKGFPLALYDVAVHGQHGWAVGNSGLLLHSGDAGVSWKLVAVPVQLRGSWFRAVSLLDGGRGFIMGARGMVLSTDGDRVVPLKQKF
jgi:photosystem II stability/assembly factor-like uncharacterized protein